MSRSLGCRRPARASARGDLRPRRSARHHLIGLVLGLALLFGGCATAPVPRSPEIAARLAVLAPRESSNLRVFDRAWDLASRKFHDPKFLGVDWNAAALKYAPQALAATDDAQLYRVINTMLAELKESHNWASTPKETAEKPEVPKARVGIQLGRAEDRWIVAGVIPDSPAEAAGVRRGWIFQSRNGRALGPHEDFSLQDGETVTDVYLDHRDEPHPLTMQARPLSIVAWRHARELAGGVVYLRFDEFDRASRRWLSAQLKAHRAAPAVVIDLRQNPGGDAFSLEIAVGEFFAQRVGWGRFISRDGEPDEGKSWQWGSAHYAGRVAVLVDESTASSGEIFARVLQFHHRAIIVGRPTAGAVIGSVYYALPDGGKLQLGVVDYQGPDGQRLEGAGVKPDFVVPWTLAELRTGVDNDLEVALAHLRQPPALPPE